MTSEKSKFTYMKNHIKKSICVLRLVVVLIVFFILFVKTNLNAQVSDPKFIQGNDTLVVYKNVPDLEPSEFYSIRVRSAATNNEWINCFANITRNRAHLVSPTSGKYGSTRNYGEVTTGWSHTYGNFEMSKNSVVEVEITSNNGFKINGLNFNKATTHPNHRASIATVDNEGAVRFTIDKPGQITIDINGQMDDYKPISNKLNADVTDVNRPWVHTISIFANPTIKKPLLNDPTVLVVEPGVVPSSNLGTKTTMYFKSGIHNLGLDFKLQPGKNYYIPGDAIVYGTFNNLYQPGLNGLGSGEKIRIYGYGTVSGQKFNHPNYDDKLYSVTEEQRKIYKPFHIDFANNTGIEGISIVDSPYHSVHLNGTSNYCKWVKVITWRGNGDGIGTCKLTEDCFLRTNDDCAYIKGNKKRCIFWKDGGGAVFHMAGIPENTPIVVEDCDVLYLRGRVNGAPGKGLFSQRGKGTVGQRRVNVLFKDFRIHDKYTNLSIFTLDSSNSDDQTLGSSYTGITFQNITSVSSYDAFGPGKSEQIMGTVGSPWNGGITFDCVTIGGKLLTSENFNTVFQTNNYVTQMNLKCSNLSTSDNFSANNSYVVFYPNPVSSVLNINFPDSDSTREIKIFTLLGQMVYSNKLHRSNAKIDFKSLRVKGVVLVQIADKNGIFHRKIMID